MGPGFRVADRRTAYGETKAPADVDTLRDEACPVCGETDSYDGNQCRVCGFVQPPKQFQDPDLGVAKQMDLRKDEGDVAPGSLGEMEDDVNDQDRDGFDDKTGLPVDGEEEGMLDEQPLLACNACGTEFPAGEPMTVDTRDPQAGDLGEGPAEGDVCPACGKGQLLSGDEEMAAEEEGMMAPPGEQDPEADPDAAPEDEERDPDAEGESPFPSDDKDDEQDDEESEEDDEGGPAKKKPSPFK